MPLTVSVGLNKKAGLPDYGSVGASCNVQFELDSLLLQQDLTTFHQQVRNAYAACSRSVNEELARHTAMVAVPRANGHSGQGNGTCGPAPANGSNQNGNGHRASEKQLGYARQLAGQINGLGVRGLEQLASRMYSKPLADLTTLEASGLIDSLKEIKAGRIALENVLPGGAA